MNRLIAFITVLLTVYLYGSTANAQSAAEPMLEASVERQTVIDGESVLLYIKGEHLQELPDVSALTRQFDVLDSRRSNSQVVEGGVIKSQFLMRFELLPKHLGHTTIPAFTADGVSTQPITIEVVERGTPGAVPRDKVFAEVTLDKETTYVQAQVVMSLHILDDGSLASVDPPVPVIPDVQVEQLPGGDQRIETRNGEEYRVHTWRFALCPQKQGDIEIPRLLIPGSVRDPGYGGGLIMRSMATRRIQIRTSPVTFTASPRAADSTADWWLPVESLKLQHQWSADIDSVTVGEPLTLTVALTTEGATSNQIPALTVPDLDGLKIYPDVPSL
ncbi:MAG: BatD family protein, partial [Pseudomonadota bacterium]